MPVWWYDDFAKQASHTGGEKIACCSNALSNTEFSFQLWTKIVNDRAMMVLGCKNNQAFKIVRNFFYAIYHSKAKSKGEITHATTS